MVSLSMYITSTMLVIGALINIEFAKVSITPLVYLTLICITFIVFAELSGRVQRQQRIDNILLIQINSQFQSIPLLVLAITSGHLNNFVDTYQSIDNNKQTIDFILITMAALILIFLQQYYLFKVSKTMDIFTLYISLNLRNLLTIIALAFMH